MIQEYTARPVIAAIICAALTCSDCRAAGPYRTFAPEGKEYSYEIPADWEIWPERGYELSIESPDQVEKKHAYIDVRLLDSRYNSIESVKEHYEKVLKQIASEDREYRLEPLETIQVGGFAGIRYSLTRGSFIKRWSTETRPVQEKLAIVYINTPHGLYNIEYTAPVAVYEWKDVKGFARVDTKHKTPSDMYKKHLPEFEHLLKTFRWAK